MEYEQAGLLHEQFVRSAERTPGKLAVVSPEENLQATFCELNTWTATLAARLQNMGVTKDSPVAILLDKGMDFVVSYISILRAGSGYLPIDTSYPEHLLQMVLEDSQPTVLITSPELVTRLHSYPSEKTIVLEKNWQASMSSENTERKIALTTPTGLTLDNLAYTVYSSGTTGKPKGIACPHRGAVFSYHDRHTNYPYLTTTTTATTKSESGLEDPSKPNEVYQGEEREGCNIFFVWELLRPLLQNVTLYIISNHTIYDPPKLNEYLAKHRITRILFTPSLLETIINTQPADIIQKSFRTLRQVWFCGEVVTTSLLERCIKLLPWVRFINLYSVSECHDVACEDLSSYYKKNQESLMSRKFCPVGHLLKGVQIVILDSEGNPQPVGKSGEIYVGGPTLALGYLNRPDVQKQRFIVKADNDGIKRRLYRTGDWGYMLSDGSLEICGRVDSMVKIRGYSIEVQAVEACLLSLPMVTACVVIVMSDEETQDNFLVAYIVASGEPNKKEVRAALKTRLPFYMIPSYFVFLQSIPVLPASGKLDKKALPPFDSQLMYGVAAEARPSTVTEIALAQMWIQVLRLKEVDIQESFFDLGGHSLLATQLLERARSSFKVELAVKDLFQYPTVSSLAALIDSRLGNTRAGSPEVTLASLDLQAEVTRHDQGVTNLDMQLRAFWRTFHHGHHFNRGRVLLTGATGFLGAFILRELLLHTKLVVYCLAREQPGVTVIERVKATLIQFGIISPEEKAEGSSDEAAIMEGLETRTTAFQGNVSLMRMGLDEEDYTYLCTDIDFVIHAAATVNLVYPYSALHGSNVLGTANVIQFASTGKVKAIHYVSTNAVFPHGLHGCREDADMNQFSSKLQDGYSQSKWVAEQLVSRARDRGLPCTIYRLGNMSGDSRRAYWNPQDLTLLILQACAKTGLGPSLDWDMEMTPVDFAAQVIVKLAQNPDMALGKTLHIINDKPMKARHVFQWMNNNGYPLRLVDFEEWKIRVVEELRAMDSNSPSPDLVAQVLDSESHAGDLSNLSTYSATRMHQVAGELGMLYPYTDDVMLRNYFTQLSTRGVIAKRKIDNGPLSGQVALITGASSGIGKATALALAAAGAKVALAARREDALQDVVKAIEADGGSAFGMKTDVTQAEELKALVQAAESKLGPVDILVNSAGVMYYTLMKNLHKEEWDRQIDVNCKGVTNSIYTVLDGMVKRKKGHIVNISSDAARRGFAGLAVYSGTKFFVEGMSQALRQELVGTNVKVTCIQPGDVKTPLQNLSTDREADDLYNGSSKSQILEPSDVARAIIYAVSQPAYVAVNEILVEPREAPI